MNIDKYLYEIIDDYKNANTTEEKNEIFRSFCSSVWSNKNKRRIYTKSIKFNVRNDLLKSEVGQIFNTWSEIEYTGYKAMTKDTDWCSLIRQKINNLYTRYFDDQVILNKDYMSLLKKPYNLYYCWIKGTEMNANELTTVINESIHKAAELKLIYQKQKMELSWNDYKNVIEEFFKKIFNNCRLIDDYENENLTNKYIYNFITEDNFYIRYICKYLENEMKQWQKKYYGVRTHKKYKRCKECGALIEIKNKKDYTTKYCDICKYKITKEQTRLRVKRHRDGNVTQAKIKNTALN